MDWTKFEKLTQNIGLNMQGVRTDNPLRQTTEKLNSEDKKLAYKDAFAATTLGITLPTLGSGVGLPWLAGLTSLPLVWESMATKNKKKEKPTEENKK